MYSAGSGQYVLPIQALQTSSDAQYSISVPVYVGSEEVLNNPPILPVE